MKRDPNAPPGNNLAEARRLREAAIAFARQPDDDLNGDPYDRRGQRLNRALLTAARTFARVVAQNEALSRDAKARRAEAKWLAEGDGR